MPSALLKYFVVGLALDSEIVNVRSVSLQHVLEGLNADATMGFSMGFAEGYRNCDMESNDSEKFGVGIEFTSNYVWVPHIS